MKSTFIHLATVGVAMACAMPAARASESAPAAKPNILFIAIDDLRPELGCYGSEIAITPNLDKLAGQGLLFNRAYCQQAICGPSRASLMTGARPDTIGVVENSAKFRELNPDIVTLSQHLIANGYEAVQVGKIFHNPDHSDDAHSWSRKPAKVKRKPGTPRLIGGYALPENQAIHAKNKKELEAKYGVGIGKTGLVHGPAYERADVPNATYRDGHNADVAIATMKEMLKNDKPFFLGLGFYKPHLDFIAPKRYWDLYDPAKIPAAAQTDAPKNGAAMGLHASFELRVRDGIPKSGPIDAELARTLKHAYLACTSYIDAQIGKMLTALDEAGVRDNTIIIVWGDHGWHLGDMGVWGKATNYEIATRVPMMIWTPGMPDNSRGRKTNALVELVDMFPTLCDLAGVAPPRHLEGTSFTPLLENPDRKWETAAFSQFPNPALREWAARPLSPGMRETFFGPLIEEVEGRIKKQQQAKWDRPLFENNLMGYTMRTDRHRLVVWKDVKNPDADPVFVELYDHQQDPAETVNVAGSRPRLVDRLLKQFHAGWKGNRPPQPAPREKLPASDPSNTGQWILNEKVSDEFDGTTLDTAKWWVEGTGGTYKHWKGRAPSQFSPDNVRVADGKLFITTKWEPDFAFSKEVKAEYKSPYEKYTTAAVIGKNLFHYGYLEIRCKAADAAITSSFWTTGKHSELDVFEFVGKSKRNNPKKVDKDRKYPFATHDWSTGQGDANVWKDFVELDWRVAADFHTYGCDWSTDGLKFYADGKLVKAITREEMGKAWVLKHPLKIWVDSETFYWEGFPDKEDLPVDFEIEYIRVWQKEIKS